MATTKKATTPKATPKVQAKTTAISCHKTKKAAQNAAGKVADKVPVVIQKSGNGYCVEKVTGIGSIAKRNDAAQPTAAKPRAKATVGRPKTKTASVGKKRRTKRRRSRA